MTGEEGWRGSYGGSGDARQAAVGRGRSQQPRVFHHKLEAPSVSRQQARDGWQMATGH